MPIPWNRDLTFGKWRSGIELGMKAWIVSSIVMWYWGLLFLTCMEFECLTWLDPFNVMLIIGNLALGPPTYFNVPLPFLFYLLIGPFFYLPVCLVFGCIVDVAIRQKWPRIPK
jgi:hypothetical protein